MNPGEEICGEWLRHVEGCDFVQYNVKTSAEQGEIDVIALHLIRHEVFACEVATHLITGMQYVKGGQPDNVARFVHKFKKNHAYLRAAFPAYAVRLMLWSPVVRNQAEGSKHNQTRDLGDIQAAVREAVQTEVEFVVNASYQERLDQLRQVARRETKELTSPIMRFLQVEEHLRLHLSRAAQRPAAKRLS
jgi:hypothetical protein